MIFYPICSEGLQPYILGHNKSKYSLSCKIMTLKSVF